jgi:hypothetical protein
MRLDQKNNRLQAGFIFWKLRPPPLYGGGLWPNSIWGNYDLLEEKKRGNVKEKGKDGRFRKV